MARREYTPHLSLDDVRFFERAMDAYNSVKNTDAATDFFIQIDQALRGKEMLVAQHKVCSRFIESYVQECPLESLQKLFTRFSGHFKELSMDKFSSHTVEHMITQGIQFIDNEITPSFGELLASVISELTPNAALLAQDPSGSHVVRCILGSLAKCEQFVIKIDKFARKIVQGVVQSHTIVRSTQVSVTLQAIAQLDQAVYGKLVKYLAASIPLKWDLITDKSGSKLAEVLIQYVGEESITSLYNLVFSKTAADAARHQIANFVLQRWLEFARDPKQIETVADNLMPRIAEFFEERPQIVVSLAAGLCHASVKYQERFITAVRGQAGEMNMVEFLSVMAPPNGPKIAQSLCEFDGRASKVFIEAMKSLSNEKLGECAADKGGSYFISGFVRSKQVDAQSRQRLVRRLIPHMKNLATTRFGEFVVDASFKASDMTTKIKICEGLDSDDVRKSASKTWKALRMDQFRSRRDQWEKDTENLMKRAEAMCGIRESLGAPTFAPIPTKVAKPTQEEAEAVGQVEETLGPIRRRRKHRHHQEGGEA